MSDNNDSNNITPERKEELALIVSRGYHYNHTPDQWNGYYIAAGMTAEEYDWVVTHVRLHSVYVEYSNTGPLKKDKEMRANSNQLQNEKKFYDLRGSPIPLVIRELEQKEALYGNKRKTTRGWWSKIKYKIQAWLQKE